MSKAMEKALWLFLFVAISCYPLVAQDEETAPEEGGDWVLADGKAIDKEGAVTRARCAALVKYIKKNMPLDDFNTHQTDIESFVEENWREYCEGSDASPVFVRKFDKQNGVRIMVKVRGDVLLKAITQKLIRARSKAEGMEAAIKLDPKKKSSKGSDVMLDAVGDELGKAFTLRDPKATEKAGNVEAAATDLSAHDDPGEFSWRKFDQIRIDMFFWLKVAKNQDESADQTAYTVTIGTRGLHRLTGQQLFAFQLQSTGFEREKTIQKVARDVAKKIIAEVANYSTVLPEQVYILKFVNFINDKDRDKIQQTIVEMENNGYMKVLPGGGASGPSYFHYRVKWHKDHSQLVIIKVVIENCLTNQVRVKCNKFSPGLMIYEPPGSNWVESAPVISEPEKTVEPDEEEPEEEDAGEWIVIKGKGMEQAYAITNAWIAAMIQYVKANMEDLADYTNQKEAIETYLQENWRTYASGDPEKPKIVKRFNSKTGWITIKIQIDGDQLMADIKQKFLRSRSKLEGMTIVALHENDTNKADQDEMLDCDAAFDTVQDVMGKYGARFYSYKAIEEKMAVERAATGQSAFSDPGSYVQQKFDEVTAVLYLRVRTTKQEEPDAVRCTWGVNISCRVVWRQTGEQLVVFQKRIDEVQVDDPQKFQSIKMGNQYVPSLRESRSRAIKAVAEVIAEEANTRIANRATVLDEKEYIFKFIGFNSTQIGKAREAVTFMSREDRPKLKLTKKERASGEGYWEVTVKWLHTKDSQAAIVEYIKSVCQQSGVRIRADNQSPGLIVFRPGK